MICPQKPRGFIETNEKLNSDIFLSQFISSSRRAILFPASLASLLGTLCHPHVSILNKLEKRKSFHILMLPCTRFLMNKANDGFTCYRRAYSKATSPKSLTQISQRIIAGATKPMRVKGRVFIEHRKPLSNI